jgi:hypothetical protein
MSSDQPLRPGSSSNNLPGFYKDYLVSNKQRSLSSPTTYQISDLPPRNTIVAGRGEDARSTTFPAEKGFVKLPSRRYHENS